MGWQWDWNAVVDALRAFSGVDRPTIEYWLGSLGMTCRHVIDDMSTPLLNGGCVSNISLCYSESFTPLGMQLKLRLTLRLGWVFLVFARLVVDQSRRLDFLTQFQLRSRPKRIHLIKDGHLPQETGKETRDFQRICTGFVAQGGQRLGERQRHTARWARHSKDTANDHLVQTCCYYSNNLDNLLSPSNLLKRTSRKMSL